MHGVTKLLHQSHVGGILDKKQQESRLIAFRSYKLNKTLTIEAWKRCNHNLVLETPSLFRRFVLPWKQLYEVMDARTQSQSTIT